MIHIDTTIGRLGNRIISIMNALHLGIHLQLNIHHIMPPNVKKIVGLTLPFPRFITLTDNSDNVVKYKHNFYFGILIRNKETTKKQRNKCGEKRIYHCK